MAKGWSVLAFNDGDLSFHDKFGLGKPLLPENEAISSKLEKQTLASGSELSASPDVSKATLCSHIRQFGGVSERRRLDTYELISTCYKKETFEMI